MYHKIGMLICVMFFLISGKSETVNQDKLIYKVSKVRDTIIVDGKMNEKDWSFSKSQTFNNYYRVIKEGDKQETVYRMLWDDENLYLFFQCKDKHITVRETKRDGQTYYDDCAELFIIPSPEALNMHYCFEVNLNKVSNDLVFLNDYHQGQNSQIKAYNPDFKVAVNINGTINDNSDIDEGWTMEFAIPIKSFDNTNKFYPVKEGTNWRFITLRQDRNEIEGERRITSTLFPIYDITKTVHQPEHFGILEFVN